MCSSSFRTGVKVSGGAPARLTAPVSVSPAGRDHVVTGRGSAFPTRPRVSGSSPLARLGLVAVGRPADIKPPATGLDLPVLERSRSGFPYRSPSPMAPLCLGRNQSVGSTGDVFARATPLYGHPGTAAVRAAPSNCGGVAAVIPGCSSERQPLGPRSGGPTPVRRRRTTERSPRMAKIPVPTIAPRRARCSRIGRSPGPADPPARRARGAPADLTANISNRLSTATGSSYTSRL